MRLTVVSRMCQVYMTLTLNFLGFSAAQVSACQDLALHVSGFSSFSITNSSQVGGQTISFPVAKNLTNNIPLCRVQGHVGYALNKSIGVEVWLPFADQWNGRYLVVGMANLCPKIELIVLI